MNTAINTPSKSIPAIVAAGFLVLGFAMSAAGAHAETVEPLIKHVTYGDLNLDSENGAKVFYARVRNAAQFVCSPLENRGLSRQQAWQACIDNALAAAVAQVNKPMVTALHNQNVGGTKG